MCKYTCIRIESTPAYGKVLGFKFSERDSPKGIWVLTSYTVDLLTHYTCITY